MNKKISILMMGSYSLMLIGLLYWDLGMILLYSIFGLGVPIIVLLAPYAASKILTGKSRRTMNLGLLASFISLIPLGITLASLPLKTHVTEAGHYIMTPIWVAPTIFISNLVFLITSVWLYFRQIKTAMNC